MQAETKSIAWWIIIHIIKCALIRTPILNKKERAIHADRRFKKINETECGAREDFHGRERDTREDDGFW
jgi:hypothetical protein